MFRWSVYACVIALHLPALSSPREAFFILKPVFYILKLMISNGRKFIVYFSKFWIRCMILSTLMFRKSNYAVYTFLRHYHRVVILPLLQCSSFENSTFLSVFRCVDVFCHCLSLGIIQLVVFRECKYEYVTELELKQYTRHLFL